MTRPLPAGLVLAKGAHDSPEDGMCLMEACAYVAGEPHTDHPECVSLVLVEFGRSLNDVLPDHKRQMLVSLVPAVVGTAGDGLDQTRRFLATDWLVRTYTPAWLRLAGLTDHADHLAGLPEVKSDEDCRGAVHVVVRAWAAARNAARNAGDAAKDTAWDAARNAGGDAAGHAAQGLVRDAVRAAVRGAVRGAAGLAAAQRVDLAPTVVELQDSAIDLLTRMIHPKGAAA